MLTTGISSLAPLQFSFRHHLWMAFTLPPGSYYFPCCAFRQFEALRLLIDRLVQRFGSGVHPFTDSG